MNKECSPLVDFLHSMGFFVAVESNGCFHITQDFDWVTISPKRQSEDWQGHTPYYVHPDNDNIVDEVKYVVDDDFDFKPCLKVWPTGVKKYLSPEFNNFEKNVARIMAFIKEHPEWKLSLQTHKWINVP